MNKDIVEKMKELEIIGEVLDFLEEKRRDTGMEYRAVGKTDKQARNWRTDELLWEDEEHTIPKYEDKYDYVEIPEEELSEERIAKMGAIDDLMIKIKKMI